MHVRSIFPYWVENRGVCVRCTFDICGFIHDDGGQVRDRVGVDGGGEEVAQDQSQEQGLECCEPHGFGSREPEVALVILFEA